MGKGAETSPWGREPPEAPVAFPSALRIELREGRTSFLGQLPSKVLRLCWEKDGSGVLLVLNVPCRGAEGSR